MSDLDSRRYARRPVELSARLSCLDPDRDPLTGAQFYRVMPVRTVDVSDGGLSVRAGEAVNSGRRVIVELDLPDGRTIEVAGRVVWLEPNEKSSNLARMGIELVELSAGLAHTVVRA